MKAFAFTLAFAVYCATALAAPAPWFKWHSPDVDYEVCAQFSPGEGWVAIKGPFEDSKCRKVTHV